MWAKTNNMSFNGDRFVVLHYGKNQDFKLNTIYLTDNWVSKIGANVTIKIFEFICETQVNLTFI